MNNNSNTGHAKNVANLGKLNQSIETFADSYKPANEKISKASLIKLQNDATEKLNSVTEAYANWKNATNIREKAFHELNQEATRLLAMLNSFSVLPQTINDVKAIVRQLRNDPKLTKADAGKAAPTGNNGNESPAEEVKTISTAKLSFDAREELYGRLVMLLQKEPGYEANDEAFTKTGLQARLNQLKQLNTAANEAYARLKAARIERNLFFYKQADGFLDTIRQVKSYVKALFGANSQQYKVVADIRFTRVVPAKKAN